jgi:type IV fimbrial biogenesis protein FimT
MNDNKPRQLASARASIAPRRSRGFNIVELMVGLTILSILIGLSAPSFREYTRETRATAAQNDLITAFSVARSEALRRSAPAALCASSDGNTCSDSDDWSTGWLAFTDATGVSGVLDGTDVAVQSWSGNSAELVLTGKDGLKVVRYLPNGMLDAAAPAALDLYMTGCSGPKKRDISIAIAGFVSTTKTTC